MKNIIITLAWLLLAPLAFAQPGSTNKKQTTAEPITVTGGIIKMTADRYVLNGFGHVVDKAGKVVQTAIKPGARLRVFYAHTSDSRAIDHVVLLD
jgi:hypothetical protein